MEFLIITGLSGAGKSRAADVLEDLDYYCVDNMPVALMPRFAELCLATRGRYEKVALVTDVRERDGFGELLDTVEELKGMDCGVRILYMDADVRTLVKRYKESRRPHPLAGPGVSVEQAVKKEDELLAPVKERADYVVNSSNLTLGMLQNRLFSLFAGEGKKREISVTVVSFGYKHGLPMDADLVFDARFLPNPYYVENLRPLCGLDRPVGEFVFSYQQTRTFMDKIEELIDFLLPLYIEEGKLGLTIAIGCTGGRHRSVAIAAALNDYLSAKGVRSVNVNRDLDK
ncbi:MAG: RNase adapter RapZ [Oscillospiraceae bacterium]|nr:RNase adapter RapZ [Oscillospiraceae bacterium]